MSNKFKKGDLVIIKNSPASFPYEVTAKLFFYGHLTPHYTISGYLSPKEKNPTLIKSEEDLEPYIPHSYNLQEEIGKQQ